MYRIQKCIGSGSYGSVFTVKKYTSNKTYAMKKVSTYRMNDKNKQQLINEIRIIKYCVCPYILPFVDCVYNSTNIEIITLYAKYGDFSKIIKKRVRKFKENIIWSYFIQSCLGIEYLHNNNIIHRDIKSANIFLTRDDHIIIGDFGISKVLLNNNKLTNTCIGTPYYMTPEMLEHKEYDKSIDIWGLGCFLFELITFRPPFVGYCIKSLYNNINTNNFNLNINVYNHIYTLDLLSFPKKIIVKDITKRMDITALLNSKEIREHQYLIPYISYLTMNIKNMNEKFKDISHREWKYIIRSLKIN